MGIVNLTDDSFYGASRVRYDCMEAIVLRVRKMVEEGAGIIDLGAASSRPGAAPVPEETELRRLSSALGPLQEAFPSVAFSVDTTSAEVVRRLSETAAPFIVNDISAGEASPEMLPLVGRLGFEYVAMHMRGTPATMQSLTGYDDVVGSVGEYFEDFSLRARDAGVRDWILDPGFGFAKTVEQNYKLLSRLSELRRFGREILVGVSRKSMIYKKFGITPEESLPATQVLHLKALQEGASILRVHDVAEAVRTIEIYRSLQI